MTCVHHSKFFALCTLQIKYNILVPLQKLIGFVVTAVSVVSYQIMGIKIQSAFALKAHCLGCDWLVVILKSKTKLWPLSNYQAFMLLDHTLFRE